MTDRKTVQEAYQKLRRGDSMTDDDLKALKKWLTSLEASLSLGNIPEYRLVHDHVSKNLRDVEGFIKARKEKSLAIFSVRDII